MSKPFAVELPDGQAVVVQPGSEAWKRCNVSYNPDGHPAALRIKMLAAAMMQEMENVNVGLDPRQDVHGVRAIADAKTMLECAQMMASKAVYVDGA